MKDVINQEPSVEQLRPIINYQVEEQPKAALALSNKLLGQFPNSVMLLNLLGASYTGINDFEAAKDNFITFFGYNNVDLKNKGIYFEL